MQTKICSKCHIKQPLINNFYKRKDNGKYRNECKKCQNFLTNAYIKANPEKHQTIMKAYYKTHIEKYKKRGKVYNKTNKEKIRITHKKYYNANKEKIKAYSKKYRELNKEKISADGKAYYKANKDKINARYRENLKSNPKFKLNKYLSCAIRVSLGGNKKGAHWEDLVGYTIEMLKKHLEKQFVNGMTWENYGKWHLDHKIPIAAFNFTKPEHADFQKCWALKNLQPLWAKENIIKKDKLTKHFQPSLLL